jgi:hypothetical protein
MKNTVERGGGWRLNGWRMAVEWGGCVYYLSWRKRSSPTDWRDSGGGQ